MRPIRVILATPPGFNPGMLVCDAVAKAWLSRNGLAERASFHRLVPMDRRASDMSAAELRRLDLGMSFQTLASLDQLEESIPVYWGDFLHMRQYHLALKQLFPDLGDRIDELLLLSGADRALRERAISFGTTLIFNSAADLMGSYGQGLRKFAEGARRILVRDMASAAQLAALHPAGGPFLGLDAAQLLTLGGDLPDVGEPPTRLPQPGSTLLFLGRSPVKDDLLTALARLKTRLGLDYRWLPWGDRRAFPRMLDGLPGLAAEPDEPLASVAGLLEAVKRARLVVTDTYHLAVIAWSLGVPAITVVAGVARGERDVSSGSALAPVDKRLVFHQQHGLQAFLLDQRALADADQTQARADNMAELIEGGVAAWHQQQVRARASWCEGELAKAIAEGGR